MAKCFLSSATWCYESWRNLSLVKPRVVLVRKYHLKNNPLLLVVEIGPSHLLRSWSVSRDKACLNVWRNIAPEKFKLHHAGCFKHSACVTCCIPGLPTV